jgi:hypothetical protein
MSSAGVKKRMIWIAALVVLCATVSSGAEKTRLFDGKTLKGWSVHSGFAKYHVEDECIVGTTVPKSPNTFLCTNKQFGDFILEFEVKLDNPELNSGVQFRSQIAPTELAFWFRDANGKPWQNVIPKDRVYGYQAEIATEKIGSSGGIYDEARRAFMMADVKDDPKASKAFKDGQWNKYRIECKGSSIKTFINDVPCADFRDSLTPRGVIGLQVHQVSDTAPPYTVRWRNIEIQVLDQGKNRK